MFLQRCGNIEIYKFPSFLLAERGRVGVALNKAIRKLWCSCSVSNLFSRKFRLLLYRNTCAAANDHHRKSDSVAVFVWHSIPCHRVRATPCTGSMVHDEYFKRFDGTIEKLWNFILNYLFGYRSKEAGRCGVFAFMIKR